MLYEICYQDLWAFLFSYWGLPATAMDQQQRKKTWYLILCRIHTIVCVCDITSYVILYARFGCEYSVFALRWVYSKSFLVSSSVIPCSCSTYAEYGTVWPTLVGTIEQYLCNSNFRIMHLFGFLLMQCHILLLLRPEAALKFAYCILNIYWFRRITSLNWWKTYIQMSRDSFICNARSQRYFLLSASKTVCP